MPPPRPSPGVAEGGGSSSPSPSSAGGGLGWGQAGTAARAIAEKLRAVGIDTHRLDSRLLVAEVLGVEPHAIVTRPELPLSPEQAVRLEALASRRIAREPMSHILGRRGFWTLDLKVTADTLDPRGDTETLIEAVLARLTDRQAPLRIVDFGTGTGAIVLSLLAELPRATGLAVDKSPAALAVAQENARTNGVGDRTKFLLSDWGRDLDECFDVIVSNPPYIPDQDIDGLEPEVAAYEPRLALAGGPDGLDCYRALIPHMARLLAPNGIAAVEVGMGQAGPVASLFVAAGLVVGAVERDLAGVERCVVAHYREGTSKKP